MSEIIEHDFGKEHRETIRAFTRLMGLAADHEDRVLADPMKYIGLAHGELARMKTELFAIWEIRALAMMATVAPRDELSPLIDTIRVDRREHEALREVYRRVARLVGMA